MMPESICLIYDVCNFVVSRRMSGGPPTKKVKHDVGGGNGSGSGSSGGGSNQAAVRNHYDSRREVGTGERLNSPIFRLKAFNNFIKSVLLDEYLSRRVSELKLKDRSQLVVLDICCGKGGDLQKWLMAGVGYCVFADHASNSVKDALKRFNEMTPRGRDSRLYPAKFIVADCHTVDLTTSYGADTWFDLVSCQFSFHYCFESESRARGLLHNISTRLKPGGYFVGTLPDSNILVKKYRASTGAATTTTTTATTNATSAAAANSNDQIAFKNAHCQVTFKLPPQQQPTTATDTDSKSSAAPSPQSYVFSGAQPFGMKYNFYLEDAIDWCDEYLVPFEALQK